MLSHSRQFWVNSCSSAGQMGFPHSQQDLSSQGLTSREGKSQGDVCVWNLLKWISLGFWKNNPVAHQPCCDCRESGALDETHLNLSHFSKAPCFDNFYLIYYPWKAAEVILEGRGAEGESREAVTARAECQGGFLVTGEGAAPTCLALTKPGPWIPIAPSLRNLFHSRRNC